MCFGFCFCFANKFFPLRWRNASRFSPVQVLKMLFSVWCRGSGLTPELSDEEGANGREEWQDTFILLREIDVYGDANRWRRYIPDLLGTARNFAIHWKLSEFSGSYENLFL